jgi:hypothetical protein
MRLTPRLVFRIVLVVLAIAILSLRLIPHHHPGPSSTPPVSTPVMDLSTSSPLNRPGGAPAPSEAYEVYSGLYAVPAGEPLVFAQNSVTDIPQVGGSCLKPSTQQEHDMADAFEAANQQSHPWEQRFTIPEVYRILAPSEAAAAQSCIATHGQDAARCASYKQVRHIRYLGVPGFDKTQTRALVSVIKSCGGDCGSGGIFAVEKSGGIWKRLETTDFTRDCSWMY